MLHIGTEDSALANEHKSTTASKLQPRHPNEVEMHDCFFTLHLTKNECSKYTVKSDTMSPTHNKIYTHSKKKTARFPLLARVETSSKRKLLIAVHVLVSLKVILLLHVYVHIHRNQLFLSDK